MTDEADKLTARIKPYSLLSFLFFFDLGIVVYLGPDGTSKRKWKAIQMAA